MNSQSNNPQGSRPSLNVTACLFFASLLWVLSSTSVVAAPTGSGLAYDFHVQISVAGVSVLDIGPVDQVGFTNSTSAYADDQTTPSFDSGGGVGVLARLQTSALDAETQWLPSSGFLAIGSRATAADVNLGVVNANSDSLLSLQAPLIQSTAIITGTCPAAVQMRQTSAVHLVDDYVYRSDFEIPNLKGTSTAIVQGAQPGDSITLSITGTNVLNIPSDPAANTTVQTGVAGATLILNEQTLSGDGNTALGVDSNGLHLNLNVLNIITADVVFSHAQASINCN